MASMGYIKRKMARRYEKYARMRAGKAQKRLASLTVADAAERFGEPSVIVLRGPAFGGGHVVELRGRGTDRRGWRVVVDGREGGLLAVGALARMVALLRRDRLQRSGYAGQGMMR